MKWRRLAGASPWCSLVIVQVMPCGRENTAYTRFVHWLAANVVLAEHNWCGHVAWGRARLVQQHAGHAVTVPESKLRDQRVLRCSNRVVTVRERKPIVSVWTFLTAPNSNILLTYLNQIKLGLNEEFVVCNIQRNRGLLRITTIKYKKIKPRVI